MSQISLYFIINAININLANIKLWVEKMMCLQRNAERFSMRYCSLCPKKMCLVSKKEDASWSTVQSIWQKGQEGTKRSNSGRKEKWTDEVVKSLIKEIPWEKRTSIRALGHVSGISLIYF